MLTQEQKARIREVAGRVVYEDVLQNPDYLKTIVDAFLDALSPLEQAEAVSNDRDVWPSYFDFDPETGKVLA